MARSSTSSRHARAIARPPCSYDAKSRTVVRRCRSISRTSTFGLAVSCIGPPYTNRRSRPSREQGNGHSPIMRSEVLDDFSDVSDWMPVASGLAELHISSEPTGDGAVMRLDFDFKGGGGFVVARKVVDRP